MFCHQVGELLEHLAPRLLVFVHGIEQPPVEVPKHPLHVEGLEQVPSLALVRRADGDGHSSPAFLA